MQTKVVKITQKKDVGILLAICILAVLLALFYLIINWQTVIWSIFFACALLCTVVCVLGMTECFVIDTENRIIYHTDIFRKRSAAFDEISSVEVKPTLFGKMVIIRKGDRVFEKIPYSLIYNNYIYPEKLVEYFTRGGVNAELLDKSEALVKRRGIESKVILAIVLLLDMVISVVGFVSDLITLAEHPSIDMKFYQLGSFWLIAVLAVLALVCVLVKYRWHFILEFIALLLFLTFVWIAVILGFATDPNNYVSEEADVAACNVIDVEANEARFLAEVDSADFYIQ